MECKTGLWYFNSLKTSVIPWGGVVWVNVGLFGLRGRLLRTGRLPRGVLGLQAQAVYVRLILTNANFYSPHLPQQFCVVLR